jgi:hypothetical protein
MEKKERMKEGDEFGHILGKQCLAKNKQCHGNHVLFS